MEIAAKQNVLELPDVQVHLVLYLQIQEMNVLELNQKSQKRNLLEYQPSGAGGTRSPPATPLRPTYTTQIKNGGY